MKVDDHGQLRQSVVEFGTKINAFLTAEMQQESGKVEESGEDSAQEGPSSGDDE